MNREDVKPQSTLPSDIPPEVRPFLEEMGYLEEDRLKVGDRAPSIRLQRLAGGPPVTLGGLRDRPTVLVFASYT